MNFAGFPVRDPQQCKQLKTRTTYLFMTDINDINSWYKCKKT